MLLLFPLLTLFAVLLFAASAVFAACLALLVPLVILGLAALAVGGRQVVVALRLLRLAGSSLASTARYCQEVGRCIFNPLAQTAPELNDGELPELCVRLKAIQFVELHRLQQQVAGALSLEPVDELWLSPGTALSIDEVAEGGRRTRFLAVGLGLVRLLSIEELRAALAHEFGHADAGHLRTGRYLRHSIRMLIHAQLSFRWFDPAFWGSGVSLAVMRGIYLPWSRAQELEADRTSARVAGAKAAIAALRKVRAEAPAVEVALEEALRRCLAGGARPKRLSEAACLLAAQLPAGQRRQLAVDSEGDPLDLGGRTHPPIAVRIAALEGRAGRVALPEPAPLDPRRLDALDERLTSLWLAQLGPACARAPAPAQPGLQAGPQPEPPELRKLTREELEAPTSDGLELDLDRSWKR